MTRHAVPSPIKAVLATAAPAVAVVSPPSIRMHGTLASAHASIILSSSAPMTTSFTPARRT